MAVVEIPRAEWGEFLESFTKQHRDWLIDVRVTEPTPGDEAEGRQLALVGVGFADEPPGRGTILLRAGKLEGSTASHTLVDPTGVRVFRRDGGADAALQIESRSGAQLVLQFRSPHPVEAVDGILG